MTLADNMTDPGADQGHRRHDAQRVRQAYYDRISACDMAPLWEKLRDLVVSEPRTQCAPAIWRFRDVRARAFRTLPSRWRPYAAASGRR